VEGEVANVTAGLIPDFSVRQAANYICLFSETSKIKLNATTDDYHMEGWFYGNSFNRMSL
jgi:hypothetical protein